MSDLIAALDRALATAGGEEIVLRRRLGDDVYATVTCIAKIDRIGGGESPAGIRLSEFSLIMSPTQINKAQWPGTGSSSDGVDPRIPRENDTDDIIIRKQPPRVVTVSDPKYVAGELVRLNLRIAG